jgi:HK97 family phage prohead protease
MDRLIVPVEWKALANADHGELDGYASVFNNVDLDGDVVLPGAFRKTLADWSTAKAPIPLTTDHQLSTDGVIGSIASAAEDSYGLKIKARFSSEAKAQSTRLKMIEGHLAGLSFIYEPLDHYRGQKGGQPVRFLRELRLYEVTVSPAPRNLLALGSAKALPAKPGLDFAAFTDAIAKASVISFEPARKAALDVLRMTGYQHEDTAGPADGQPTVDAAGTGDAAADTGKPADGTAQKAANQAAEYALSIISKTPEPPDGALGGEPPQALAGPLDVLDIERAGADQDRLEAEILTARGGNA